MYIHIHKNTFLAVSSVEVICSYLFLSAYLSDLSKLGVTSMYAEASRTPKLFLLTGRLGRHSSNKVQGVHA